MTVVPDQPEPTVPSESATPSEPTVPSRSLARSVAVGVALVVGMAAITFFLIAIPFYTLASFESNGIDRPIVRTGLFRIALPVGLVVGVIGGSITGRWLHRGGRWTVEDGGDRYSTR